MPVIPELNLSLPFPTNVSPSVDFIPVTPTLRSFIKRIRPFPGPSLRSSSLPDAEHAWFWEVVSVSSCFSVCVSLSVALSPSLPVSLSLTFFKCCLSCPPPTSIFHCTVSLVTYICLDLDKAAVPFWQTCPRPEQDSKTISQARSFKTARRTSRQGRPTLFLESSMAVGCPGLAGRPQRFPPPQARRVASGQPAFRSATTPCPCGLRLSRPRAPGRRVCHLYCAWHSLGKAGLRVQMPA